MEIPPHARRRAGGCSPAGLSTGNTSACAEKSVQDRLHDEWWGKYLRMRGEESPLLIPRLAVLEIPPHARRRVLAWQSGVVASGNTSACAEKSEAQYPGRSPHWKYLRMRGEEGEVFFEQDLDAEIPPHARRRGGFFGSWGRCVGNTSACAEKRMTRQRPRGRCRKYLRMRGEETTSPNLVISPVEIPPHARRRVERMDGLLGVLGNTSACAEKSLPHLGLYFLRGGFFGRAGNKVLARRRPSMSMIVRRWEPRVLTANPCSRSGSRLIIVSLPDLIAVAQRVHRLLRTRRETLPTYTPVSTSERKRVR